jgi:archaeosine synthase alpha-subunit
MATLILNFGRCSHGKCVFCGYGRIRGHPPCEDKLIACFRDYFEKLRDPQVKVFGSGSFLDEDQVPAEARKHFIRECEKRQIRELSIESRPEHINPAKLSEFSKINTTIALGLESANDGILETLQKGYGTKEYAGAAKAIHEAGHKVRTYLLVNLPYPGWRQDLDESVDFALKHSDSVVLINLLPHARAPLFGMWIDGEWSFLSKSEYYEAVEKWADNPRVETDVETFHFIPSFPEDKMDDLSGVGEWYLTHPHFEVWQDYILRWYEPSPGRTLLFLPCAKRKPYRESKTHKAIIERLKGAGRMNFHEVMISNAGVIPRELESKYPFAHYDWDESLETPEIKKRYVQVTCERIKKYLKAHKGKYQLIACYLKPDSESHKALSRACEELGISCRNLLTGQTYDRVSGGPSPLITEAALDDLTEGLNWCARNSRS